MKPQRVQRKRTKGWRMPENTVYVGRGSTWGNPYKIGEVYDPNGKPATQERAVELFDMLYSQTAWRDMIRQRVEPLRGKNLACWCSLDQPCHADILLRIANED